MQRTENNQQQQGNYSSDQHKKNVTNDDIVTAECPQCHRQINADADVCPYCHVWQVLNHCCFCLSAVNQGQRFCSKCGNPPSGSNCKTCGTFSIFDYCPNCNSPVSRDAAAYLNRLLDSDEIKALIDEVEVLQTALEALPIFDKKNTETAQPDWLKQLDENGKNREGDHQSDADYASRHHEGSSGFVKKDSRADLFHIIELADKKRADMETTISLKDQAIALEKKVDQLQQKLFADNQSARKFYGAIKILLPQLKVVKNRTYNGWKCHWTETVHVGPQDCGRPELGGIWIYDEHVTYETDFKEI